MLSPGQFLPEHRVAALKAIQQAGEYLTTSPEGFRSEGYDDRGRAILRSEHPVQRGAFSRSYFDLDDEDPKYVGYEEYSADNDRPHFYTSPDARRRLGFIEQRDASGVWHSRRER